MSPSPLRRALVAVGALAAAGSLLAACGSDSTSSDTTTATTASTGTTVDAQAVVQRFDRAIQQQLAIVGCYSGAIDGILGPKTDAAIVAFQSASGLAVDGEIGPNTQAALTKAANANTKVCTGSPATTTPPTTKAPTPTDPACSATALATALPSGFTVSTFVCADVYAGVQGVTSAGGATQYDVLEWAASGGTYAWKVINVCGGASAGIPAPVLETGCNPNS